MELSPVIIIGLHSRDVVALWLSLSACSLSFINRLQSILENLWTRGTNERIRPPGHGNSPVTHRAARVRLCDFGECIKTLGIPEREQHGKRAIKLLLSGGDTRQRTEDLSHPFTYSPILLRPQRRQARSS